MRPIKVLVLLHHVQYDCIYNIMDFDFTRSLAEKYHSKVYDPLRSTGRSL